MGESLRVWYEMRLTALLTLDQIDAATLDRLGSWRRHLLLSWRGNFPHAPSYSGSDNKRGNSSPGVSRRNARCRRPTEPETCRRAKRVGPCRLPFRQERCSSK